MPGSLEQGDVSAQTVPNATTHPPAAPVDARRTLKGVIDDLLELSKARLCMLVVFTTAIGAMLATRGPLDWTLLFWTALGTTLSAFGANAMNQCVERHRDARMNRTRNRPLPAGRISPAFGWAFAAGVGLLGPLVLAWQTNVLTTSLSLGCLALYVLVYTPMKTRSTFNTLVGAVCGAIPPMMGWAAQRGSLDIGAWVLGAILFLWQIPHFLALAWMYREDYERGGFRMLPVVDETGRRTCDNIVLYCLALIPTSLLLYLTGNAGLTYALAALILGAAWCALCVRLYRTRTVRSARAVFLGSITYLPLLMGAMIVDRLVRTVG